MKLPSASEMQALEHLAIVKYKIPSLVLMENAGAAMARSMERRLGPCTDSFCAIFIGPGNNGGDGLVVGRQLYQRGCQPVFFLLTPPEQFRADAKTNLSTILAQEHLCYTITTEEQVQSIPSLLKPLIAKGLHCYAVIDAIFGIGLSREVEGHYKATIELANTLANDNGAPLFSVDIASGLHTDTGRIMGTAIHADHTITFACAKPGHFLASGKAVTGTLETVDIGIPPQIFSETKIAAELITRENLQVTSEHLLRDPTSHKGRNGHVLIVAGSYGKSGAAILAARGALRAGVGLVSIASTPQNNTLLQMAVPEAMTLPFEKSEKFLSCNDWFHLKKSFDKYDCIVVGPGLGQHPDTADLVRHIFHDAAVPVVIDADALNILAYSKEKLHPPGGVRIYTPHPGEMARLCKCSVEEVLSDSCATAEKACRHFTNKKYPALMVAKGAATLITCGDGHHFINATGNPAMATGGMGDVLSGIIGALLCQGLSPLPAVTCAVYLHGLAADILAQTVGTGIYASEVADALPTARRQLLEKNGTQENQKKRYLGGVAYEKKR